jgi:hypothetical protein
MTINMKDSHKMSIAQIRSFLKTSAFVEFKVSSIKEKYTWIENTLNKFRYFKLRKKDKSVIANSIVVKF